MNDKYRGLTYYQIVDLGHDAQRRNDYRAAAEAYREAARVAAWPQDHAKLKDAASECERLALTLQR